MAVDKGGKKKQAETKKTETSGWRFSLEFK
jgi:hypothetical protein